MDKYIIVFNHLYIIMNITDFDNFRNEHLEEIWTLIEGILFL